MENFLFCLNATMPVFLLMVLGFFFRRINLIDDHFVAQANKFVFAVPLPLLVFKDLAGSDFHTTWDGRFVAFCFLVTLASILLAFVLSLFFRKKVSQGEFIQASYRSSAAILGVALIMNIYGDADMGPLMIIGSVPLYNIMAVVVLEFFKPGHGKITMALIFKALKGVITNPIILGILAGLLWSLLSIPQPAVMSKTIAYVSNLATPLGLLSMGASFDLKKCSGSLFPAFVCSFMKLVGYAALFLPLAVSLGFRGSQLVAILIMLGSATTVSCFVMAKNMGHEATLTSSVVKITTLGCAFTLTGWLYILKVFAFI